jgi:hypothetical protein
MPVSTVDVRPLHLTRVLRLAVVFVALVLGWLGATLSGALARDFPLPPRGADIGAPATAPLAGVLLEERVEDSTEGTGHDFVRRGHRVAAMTPQQDFFPFFSRGG